MNAQTLTTASRLALALLFLAAAPLKILFPADFAEAIATYLILPDGLINVTALTLPWLEAVVAILLLCRVWTGPTLFLANAMLGIRQQHGQAGLVHCRPGTLDADALHRIVGFA